MIGKCHYYLRNTDEAKEYFLKAKDYIGESKDDIEARTDAQEWLKKL